MEFFAKTHNIQANHSKNIKQSQFEERFTKIPDNTPTELLRLQKAKRLRNCYRAEETEETGQLRKQVQYGILRCIREQKKLIES